MEKSIVTNLKLNTTKDKDILDQLEAVKNKNKYLKDLVRKDIVINGLASTKDITFYKFNYNQHINELLERDADYFNAIAKECKSSDHFALSLLSKKDEMDTLRRMDAFRVVVKESQLARSIALAENADVEWKICRSESGSLKVGNAGLSVLLPNGAGDGQTRYAVVKRQIIDTSLMSFFTILEGSIDIFTSDYSDVVKETITGRYAAYYGCGLVVLVDAIFK